MSHLHIPDGILPPALWVAGLLLAAILLGVSAWRLRRSSPLDIAFQSALAGIMLAVMAIPLPITAFEYCMTLAGPVGVLVGASRGFQIAFVVTLILALIGQGGFTVIGLNALVMGVAVAVARPAYRIAATAAGPPVAMAVATAFAQTCSTLAWVAILVASARLIPSIAREHDIEHVLQFAKQGVLATVLIPLLGVAIAVESALGYGLARFLDRVRPDLLPSRPAPNPWVARPGAA